MSSKYALGPTNSWLYSECTIAAVCNIVYLRTIIILTTTMRTHTTMQTANFHKLVIYKNQIESMDTTVAQLFSRASPSAREENSKFVSTNSF